MPKFFALALLLAALGAPSFAVAAEPARCLSPKERREAIVKREAMPLGRAVRLVRNRLGGGELVRARLCESSPGLVYMLTVLTRNGKVASATLDAKSGQWLAGR